MKNDRFTTIQRVKNVETYHKISDSNVAMMHIIDRLLKQLVKFEGYLKTGMILKKFEN